MMLPGYSRAVIRSNIRQLCKETGCDNRVRHAQNVAIVLDYARAHFRRTGTGPLPKYLQKKRGGKK